MHPAEDQNGEPKERSIVSRFKNSQKYLRNISIVSVLAFLLGLAILWALFCWWQLGIKEFLFSLAFSLLQLSITIFIVNILLHQSIESPRRFLIWDANRELEEFSRHNPSAGEIAKIVLEIDKQGLDRDRLLNALVASKKVWTDFLSLKSRTQNAREGSKELAHKYWAFELVLMAEMDFLSQLSDIPDRDISSGNFKMNMKYRGVLESLHHRYSMKMGGLPMPPKSPYWPKAVASIEQHLWPS